MFVLAKTLVLVVKVGVVLPVLYKKPCSRIAVAVEMSEVAFIYTLFDTSICTVGTSVLKYAPLRETQLDLFPVNAKLLSAENVSYAIKVSYLKNLIDVLPTSPALNTVNSLSNLSLADQVKLVNKFVYIIEVR